ncbi:hypothetical protein [Dictyobacter formicarum]|uniref:hypothetical protein n=1 Tax=Dictyobacter formicarum TaxID=2778368 RepID=UPI0019163AB6|nr:hypothetical protein [Dictyobacter formicarum]
MSLSGTPVTIILPAQLQRLDSAVSIGRSLLPLTLEDKVVQGLAATGRQFALTQDWMQSVRRTWIAEGNHGDRMPTSSLRVVWWVGMPMLFVQRNGAQAGQQ